MTKRKYKIGDVVDLDDVAISPAALAAWQAIAQTGARALPSQVPRDEIPDEQGLWLASGELEIFIEISGMTRISMKIPPDQWVWADPKKNN